MIKFKKVEMKRHAMYVLALYAVRVNSDAEHEADRAGATGLAPLSSPDATRHHVEHRLIADAVIAASDEEAKRMGVERVLARCPADEGWIYHEVTVAIVTREFLLDAVRQADETRDDSDAPEMVM